MKQSEPPTKQELVQTESISVAVITGGILGCILGTVAMLLLHLFGVGFYTIMVGSGFTGLLCFMPITSLIIGGIPGGIVGGLIGLMSGTYFKNSFE
jgi:hypothetical protein